MGVSVGVFMGEGGLLLTNQETSHGPALVIQLNQTPRVKTETREEKLPCFLLQIWVES